MLDALRSFLGELTGETAAQDRFDDGDYRLAAAALLVHVTGIDGEVSAEERRKLHSVLKYRFDLTDADTDALVDLADRAEGDAVDMYQFTTQLNRSLDEEGRRRIIEMMWEIIFADGHVSEFEDNVVWRVADLLNVPSRERLALRSQIAGELAAEHGAEGAAAVAEAGAHAKPGEVKPDDAKPVDPKPVATPGSPSPVAGGAPFDVANPPAGAKQD